MAKKILFLCAHNQSRSVTAEGLLTGERGYEVRSRALWRGAKRKVSKWDAQWADVVYVMMPGMKPVAEEAGVNPKKIRSLWVPDAFVGCEKALIETLKIQLAADGIHVKKSTAKAQRDCERIQERKMGFRLSKDWDWFGSGYVTPARKGEFAETTAGGYVPLWHFEEGEKRRREAETVEQAQVREAKRLLRLLGEQDSQRGLPNP